MSTNVNIEQYVPVVQEHGLNTDKDASFGGDFSVAGDFTASDTAVTAGGALGLNVSSAATAPNVYFGSGAPTVSANKGSLYLRTDGSSTSTRLYVNTDGGTTWTSVTTAA